MAVTLEQIQKNTLDAVQAGVIDEFRKSSYLFDHLPFDNAVTPGTTGGTLTYGYTRLTTQATVATRDFNAEYTPQHAIKTRYTVDLKVFGGAFTVDRVFSDVGGLVDEVTFQTSQKVKATRAKFHDLVINGNSESTPTDFDGLDVALTESSTEFGDGEVTDWSGIDTKTAALKAVERIEDWLSLLDGKPTIILGNSQSIKRLRFMARWAEYLTESEDSFGRKVEGFNGTPFVDLGDKPGSTSPIIPIETREVGESEVNNLTDLYAVRLSMDGFHGVSLYDVSQLIQTYLDEFQPGYRQSGSARRGEVEMVSAVALRATKAAAVFRNIKVA